MDTKELEQQKTESAEMSASEQKKAQKSKESSKKIVFALVCVVAVVAILGLLAWDPFGVKVDVNDPSLQQTADPDVVTEFNYSEGIDENGRWEGVDAQKVITLPEDYNHLKIALSDVTPTADDVAREVSAILGDYSEMTDYTGVLAAGDFITYDFKGMMDGVQFDGGTAENQTMSLGSGGMIPGFEEGIIGHSVGETFDIDVTFPEDYGDEGTDRGKLNGKPAVFTITVHSAQRSVTPELTDEFVATTLKDSYDVTTVAELKESVKEALKQQNINDYVDNYLIENSIAIGVPESMIEYQKNANAYYFNAMASYYGLDLATYLSYFFGCSTLAEAHEMNAEVYGDAARYFLVCQAIADKEGIVVTDADVEDYFNKTMGGNDFASYQDFYGKPYLKCVTMDTMVIDSILANATIE